MNISIVIPARYASSRFPGKPLVELKGPDGVPRSLIEWSWRAGSAVKGVTEVVVATDDERIAESSRAFGAKVAMTSEDCANGTERCADALDQLDAPDLVVNLQGDAPLTPPWFIEDLIDAMKADPSLDAATPVLRCDGATMSKFLEDRRAGRVGGTTAVFAANGDGLYFSKEVIPFTSADYADDDDTPVFHHVGVYAYSPAALKRYQAWEAGPLETLEGLEQLRFLENGARVRCVEVTAPGRVFWEVNNPVDVARVEAAMAAQGAA